MGKVIKIPCANDIICKKHCVLVIYEKYDYEKTFTNKKLFYNQFYFNLGEGAVWFKKHD